MPTDPSPLRSAWGFQFGEPGVEWYARATVPRSETLSVPSMFTSPGGRTQTLLPVALLSQVKYSLVTGGTDADIVYLPGGGPMRELGVIHVKLRVKDPEGSR